MVQSSLLKIFALNLFIYYVQTCNVKEILEAKEDPDYRKTWMYIPDDKGVPHKIYLNHSAANLLKIKKKLYSSPENKATFWLYTKKSKRSPIQLKTSGIESMTSFQFTNRFDGKKPTKIIIHGWRNNINSDSVAEVRSAYLDKAGKDYNIIAVDWEEAASDILYFTSAYATKSIGEYVAHVINHMHVKHGANLTDIHIIGHSLGAHVSGIAGSVFQSLSSGEKVGRITGTDPALPFFENTSEAKAMLDSSDAEFVDVIHTCAGLLGHDENLGHADFFPNGGEQVQPGCDYFINDLIGTCSHEKSFKYFVETITNPNKFMAQKCGSWNEFKSDKCSGEKVPMGDVAPRNAIGQYYLRTGGSSSSEESGESDESDESDESEESEESEESDESDYS